MKNYTIQRNMHSDTENFKKVPDFLVSFSANSVQFLFMKCLPSQWKKTLLTMFENS